MNVTLSDKYRNKTKKLGGVLLCMALTVCLVGCKGNAENNKPATAPSATTQTSPQAVLDIQVGSLAEELYTGGDYTDELTVLEEDMFDVVFQTVDLDLVTSKAAYVGSGASAEQIVVVEAKDEEAASKVKEQLEMKLQDDIDMNQDYLPQEVSKLEKPVLVMNGKYVVLCVSNDNEKIEQVLLKKGIMS